MKAIILMLLIGAFAQSEILLTPANTINMRGEVTAESMQVLMLQLQSKVQERASKDYPLYLVIDSGGGSIDAGLAFIEYAKSVPNLHTISLFAASMASGIQQALPGKRIILESSILMFHRAQGGFQGQFGDGEVESRLDMAKQIVNVLEQKNADRMLMSLVNYKKAVVNEYWLVGKNAINKNGADVIESLKCSPELIASQTEQTFQVFVFTLTVRFSDCPLFRSGTMTKGQDKYNQYASHFNRKLPGIYQSK